MKDVEIMTIVVVAIIFIVILAGLFFSFKLALKESKKNMFVFTNTGNRYVAILKCKVKVPTDGSWVNGIIYQQLEDRKMYVREEKDFYSKFVPLKDWENEKVNTITGSINP